jgi:type IV pilus assembly protein PilO
MGVRHADRLWIFAGAAFTVALAVISWFFLISPQYAEAAEVRNETSGTEIQIVKLNKRIAELEQQKTKLPQFKRALKANRAALPSDSGLPDFLRQLQSSGDNLNVTVDGVSVSGAALVPGFTSVWSLPITLTLQGTPENLDKFLHQLQQTQPRAVLINSAAVTSQVADAAADGASTDDVTISLALQAFVSMPAGSGAPSITTTAATK